MVFRIGFGYDTHRFSENRKLIIGGVKIPHHHGLLGHSDADVLLHAICDALLGAAGLRDIGYHFPDNDPAYKNADSKVLLGKVYELLKKDGWKISNLDSTIVAEQPKMNPHIPSMSSIISEILGCTSSQVSIKATTNEKMGPIGNGEGIAAYCNALIFK